MGADLQDWHGLFHANGVVIDALLWNERYYAASYVCWQPRVGVRARLMLDPMSAVEWPRFVLEVKGLGLPAAFILDGPRDRCWRRIDGVHVTAAFGAPFQVLLKALGDIQRLCDPTIGGLCPVTSSTVSTFFTESLARARARRAWDRDTEEIG